MCHTKLMTEETKNMSLGIECVALFRLKNDLIKHTKFVYIQKHFFFNRNGKCNWYQNRFEYILVSHPFLPVRILWCLLHFKSQDPFKHNKKEGDTRNYFCIMYGCVTLRLKPAYFQSDTSFSNAQNGTYLFFQTGNEKWKNESRVKNKNQIFTHSIILC